MYRYRATSAVTDSFFPETGRRAASAQPGDAGLAGRRPTGPAAAEAARVASNRRMTNRTRRMMKSTDRRFLTVSP
jgi:hypothetical protein